MSEQRKTPPEGQALTEAQQARTHARADFHRMLVASIARLIAHPDELYAISHVIVAESHRVSDKLDDADRALVDRIAGMIGKDQTDQAALQDTVTDLQRQLDALTKDAILP